MLTVLVVVWQLPQVFLLGVWCAWAIVLLGRCYLPKKSLVVTPTHTYLFASDPFFTGNRRRVQLAYQSNYWMVLQVSYDASRSPLVRAIQLGLLRYCVLYRDQFAPPDYRYMRSCFSVMKFIGEPTLKSES